MVDNTTSMAPAVHDPRPTKVLVIGAGWGGLAAAKTYLSVSTQLVTQQQRNNTSSNPSTPRLPPIDLTILDAHSGVGGVWSADRLYPGLYAHAPTGLFEYGDASMVDEAAGRPRYSPLSGERIGVYLREYAEEGGLMRRCRFGERVVSVRRRRMESEEGKGEGKGEGANAGWVVVTDKVRRASSGVIDDNDGKEQREQNVYECDKLVLATGLYNKPRLPDVPQRDFTGVSIHSCDMGQQFERLTTDRNIKHVLVVGAAKSAAEACNLFLPPMHPDQPRGRFSVTWVVKPGGKGVNFLTADLSDPSGTVEVMLSRAAGVVHPNVWETRSWCYWFFHSGRCVLGMWLVGLYWWLLDWAVKRGAGYDKSKNGAKLKPTKDRWLEWDLNAVAQLPPGHAVLEELHKDDDEVLRVRRAEVRQLQGREAVLVDGGGKEERVPCDAIIWCTGWLPSVDFFDNDEARRVGVPVPIGDEDAKMQGSVDEIAMDEKAERRLLELFPRLRQRRPAPDHPPQHTEYTLLRHIVSPWCLAHKDRSIVFANMTANGGSAMAAQVSALWAVAWCEGMLRPADVLPLQKSGRTGSSTGAASRDEILNSARWEIAIQNAHIRRRWGEKRTRDPEVLTELQAYLDQLCLDLDLNPERKRKGSGNGLVEKYTGWKKEWFSGYTSADYNGIIEEYLGDWTQRQEKLET